MFHFHVFKFSSIYLILCHFKRFFHITNFLSRLLMNLYCLSNVPIKTRKNTFFFCSKHFKYKKNEGNKNVFLHFWFISYFARLKIDERRTNHIRKSQWTIELENPLSLSVLAKDDLNEFGKKKITWGFLEHLI